MESSRDRRWIMGHSKMTADRDSADPSNRNGHNLGVPPAEMGGYLEAITHAHRFSAFNNARAFLPGHGPPPWLRHRSATPFAGGFFPHVARTARRKVITASLRCRLGHPYRPPVFGSTPSPAGAPPRCAAPGCDPAPLAPWGTRRFGDKTVSGSARRWSRRIKLPRCTAKAYTTTLGSTCTRSPVPILVTTPRTRALT